VAEFIVQKVDWYQLRAPDGQALLVMVASLPNGFCTATPCEVAITHGDHSLIGLAPSAEDALAELQKNLEGKTRADIFPPKDH
jgi:hypothetical protein